MKVVGEKIFTELVPSLAKDLVFRLKHAGYTVAKGPTRLVVEKEVGTLVKGEYSTVRLGVRGISWWKHQGHTDFIDIVSSNKGTMNVSWLADLKHELCHALLWANNYPVSLHHAIMKKIKVY